MRDILPNVTYQLRTITNFKYYAEMNKLMGVAAKSRLLFVRAAIAKQRDHVDFRIHLDCRSGAC
jgi:hypothetical protein